VGPPWLKLPPEDWPSGEPQPDDEVVMQYKRKSIVSSLLCKGDKADWYYAFSSNCNKVVHFLAWVLQFVNSCHNQRKYKEYTKYKISSQIMEFTN
jgi:hypothetical protein